MEFQDNPEDDDRDFDSNPPARNTGGLELHLTIEDREVLKAIEQFDDADERCDYALHALKIGVLALQRASGQLDAEAMKHEGERVIQQLETRNQTLREGIKAELERYFDPKSGQLPQRVERLVRQDGELEVMLRRYVSAEDSVLTQSLAKLVGESSPLRSYLDPNNKSGFVEHLRTQQEAARKQILDQFTLDDPNSALGRLVKQVRTENADLTKELDLTNEESALGRLIQKVERAQQTIVAEFSLDNEKSALKRLLNQLEGELKDQREVGEKFQTEVRASLESMKARKEERTKGTGHGLDFEQALYGWLQSNCTGHVVDSTGNSTGAIKNCKVGDVVVQLDPEHRAAGARIVFEAKKDQGYSLQKALAEVEIARRNRDAEIGVFCFAKATAPEGQPAFSRHGDDLVVVWDHEDHQSDVYLKAAWAVATALASKARSEQSGGADRRTIDGSISNIEKRLGNLDEIRTWAQTVQSNGQKIAEKTDSMRKAVLREVETLRSEVQKLDG